MSILTCCVHWFCTEQPGSFFSLVPPPRRQALLSPPFCQVPPQQAACYGGTRCSLCPFTHRAVARPCPLSLLIGSLAVTDSSRSQWLLLLFQPMRRGSPGIAETPVHIAGSRGALECTKVKNLEPLGPL
ncbi:unnamed protein product [Staurois parvus]|uniref:Uncharacterized protein n=1 Tax=Staurois parvus TaxID=386267 RepID=A0ABN9BUS9_9NEOB|nr:unnamed protein product [Staurois parvus]